MLLEDAIRRVNDKIRSIDQDIAYVENSIKNRSDQIQEICRELEVRFNPNDPTASADEAERKINQKTASLKERYNSLREREIIFQETDYFSIEIDPRDDIAKKTMELHQQLNRDKGITDGLELFERIENLKTVQSNTKFQSNIYREVEEIWFFPIPSDNTFKVSMFAKFRITDQRTFTPEEIEAKKDEEKRDKQRKAEEERKRIAKQEAKRKRDIERNNRRIKRKEWWNNFFNEMTGVSIQYHTNKHYQLFDVGFNIVDYYEEFTAYGMSAGWYWKDGERNGLSLRPFFDYGTPIIGEYSFGVPISLHVGGDAKIGIGEGSFLAFMLKIGLSVGPYFYMDIGPEFNTIGSTSFIFQIGTHLGDH